MERFGGTVNYELERRAGFWAGARHAGRRPPNGHASGDFALLSPYFAMGVAGRPALRWQGLAMGVGAGLLFGALRILPGAHFASKTIWSGVACAAHSGIGSLVAVHR